MCFPKHRALAFLPYVPMCLIFCWLVAEHQPKEKLSTNRQNTDCFSSGDAWSQWQGGGGEISWDSCLRGNDV